MIYRSKKHGLTIDRGDGKNFIHFQPNAQGHGEFRTDDPATQRFIEAHAAFRRGNVTRFEPEAPPKKGIISKITDMLRPKSR